MSRINLRYMPSQPKTYVKQFQKLDGGLNLWELDYLLPDNQSSDMLNLWWHDGVLQCRDGQRYVTASPYATAEGYTCCSEPFWDYIFFHIGSKIYYVKSDQLSPTGDDELPTPIDLTPGKTPLIESRGTFFRFRDWLMYKNPGGFYRIEYKPGSAGAPPQFQLVNMTEDPFTPVIAINADPATGSGDLYQPENRLSAKKTVWYNVGSTKTYYATSDGGTVFVLSLATGDTLAAVVSVYAGATLIPPTGYTVDPSANKITLSAAQPAGTEMTFIVWVGSGNYKLPVSGDDVTVTHIEVDGTERPVFQWPERQPKPKTVSVPALSGSGTWRYVSGTGVESTHNTLGEAITESDKDNGAGVIVLTSDNYKLAEADRQTKGAVYFCRPTKNVTVDLGGHILTDSFIPSNDTKGLNLFHPDGKKNPLYPECTNDITIRIQNGTIEKTTSRSIVAVGTKQTKATDIEGKISVILKDVKISYSGSSSLFTSYSPNTALAIDGCDLTVNDESTEATSAVSFIMSADAGWPDEQQSPWSVLIRDSTIRAKNHIVYYETRNEVHGPQITLIGKNTFAYTDESCSGFKWVRPTYELVDDGILRAKKTSIGLLSAETLTNYDALSPLPEPTESEGYYSFSTDDKGAGWLDNADSVVHIPNVRATVPPTNNTVRITYSKPNEDALKSILDCRYARVFQGADDMCILLAGSEAQPNAFFWSGNTDVGMDPSYFPMSYYNLAGDTNDAVTGFGSQYSSYILFKERQIGKLEYSIDTVDNRNVIAFNYTVLNSLCGCDLPWTIQLIENNLVWCNKDTGVHMLQATSPAYENNVLHLSKNIDGTETRKGLLSALRGATADDVVAFDDNNRYWLVIQSEADHKAYLWDYLCSAPSAPSWFPCDNIPAIAFFRIYNTVYHLDKHGRVTKMERRWLDYENAIEKRYVFPPQAFGGYDRLKDITDLVLSVRADTDSNTMVEYLTDYEIRADQTIITPAGWHLVPRNLTFRSLAARPFAYAARRRPGCRHVQHFTVRLTNKNKGEDLAILSAQIFYRYTERMR